MTIDRKYVLNAFVSTPRNRVNAKAQTRTKYGYL